MIDLALAHLIDFEQWLKTMQTQVDSKQSTRIFSSNVWIRDRLEAQFSQHLAPTRTYLTDLKQNTSDSAALTNLVASIKHCDQVIVLVTHLIDVHKQSTSDTYARSQWAQTLPALMMQLMHLRNRLTITNKLVHNTREREKDDWLREL